ncbi:hypothetical protein IKE98_01510 [Candidatus Saccharibacteria bacterium]|nr:hypothetical protein [Candidatus Saccharibacteria bacterium]
MPDDSATTIQDNNVTTPPADDFATPAMPDSGAADPSTPAPDPTPTADGSFDVNPAPEPTPGPIPEPNPEPTVPASELSEAPIEESAADREMYTNIANKISESHNILIALSSDPSVDEMSAAIGLSLFLDKLGKRATAIYSGSTPNALEFLNPEQTFEPSADSLQDFVIALNKDKADHLRYKLDGDYVKIYITPYQSKINPEDLEFSYGDFNVDLVLALDIANGIDLDSALREHGRIMHDAVIINITTGNPGKFGEIEWSDKRASSVSEMVAKLLYSINSEVPIGKEEATAFLTGIVAATNRFSKANTTPETMQISSKLMRSGANQQLISKNITPDVENEMISMLNTPSESQSKVAKSDESAEPAANDATKLDIKHDGGDAVDESAEVSDTITEKPSTLLDDLKAAEASLAQTGSETTPDTSNQPKLIGNTTPKEEPVAETQEETPAQLDTLPEVQPMSEPETEAESSPAPELNSLPEPETTTPGITLNPENAAADTLDTDTPVTDAAPEIGIIGSDTAPDTEPATTDSLPEVPGDADKAEKVIAPSADFEQSAAEADSDKYGRMLEEAISDLTNPGSATALNSNPATASTPEVSTEPEINGVPEMNFNPPEGENILPPPPAPPIDMSAGSLDASLPTEPAPAAPLTPAAPAAEPAATAPLDAQPTMQSPASQADNAGAFKIPGM